MKLKESYAQPGYLVRRVHQIATAAFMTETRDTDLTPVQFAALLAIRENPGIDATRVSDLISIDRTTIGHVVTLLERKKLITRRVGTRSCGKTGARKDAIRSIPRHRILRCRVEPNASAIRCRSSD